MIVIHFLRRTFVAAIAVVLALGGSALAWAQDKAERSPEEEARYQMHRYASCIYRADTLGAKMFLRTRPGTLRFQNAMKRFSAPRCAFSKEQGFSSEALQGAMFRVVYADRFESGGPRPLASRIDLAGDVEGDSSPEAARYVMLRDFAQCVVRAAPAESRALVLASIGSPEEKAAFAALTPALGPCIDNGGSMKLDRQSLSALVSEALYRLTVTASAEEGR